MKPEFRRTDESPFLPSEPSLLAQVLEDQLNEEWQDLPTEDELCALYQNDLFDQRLKDLLPPQESSAVHPHLRRLGRVAASLTVAVAVGFTALMTSQAFREQMFHLIFEEEPTHTTISIDDSDEATRQQLKEAVKEQAVYKLTWLPEGYELEERDELHSMIIEQYNTPDGGVFLFDQTSLNTTVALDTEDADVVKHSSMNGNECIYIEKRGYFQMLWQNGNAMLHLSGNGQDLNEAVLFRIAEGVTVDVAASRRYTPAERPCIVGWVPDEFELVREETSVEPGGMRELEYQTAEGAYLLITQQRYNDAQWPNWEEADERLEAEVNGEYASILRTGGERVLYWDDFRFLFIVSSDALSEEDLLQVGNSITLPEPMVPQE